jgi:hypothetical protein
MDSASQDLPPTLVQNAPVTDRWTVRLVVVGLAIIAIACVIGSVWLTAIDRTLPDSTLIIGGAAAGSLGTLLASTKSGRP